LQRELQTAIATPANQNHFTHLELIRQEVFLLTQRLMNVQTQVVQGSDVIQGFAHKSLNKNGRRRVCVSATRGDSPFHRREDVATFAGEPGGGLNDPNPRIPLFVTFATVSKGIDDVSVKDPGVPLALP
jgi:hypothetical protein